MTAEPWPSARPTQRERFGRLARTVGRMTSAITRDTSSQLRDVVDEALRTVPGLTDNARAAFARLVDVLESSDDAVVFPAEATISTSEAAALLGISRMSVVRLIDRGALQADISAVHRRIPVTELARYQTETRKRRRSALADLASDITDSTPADQVIATR